MITRMITFCGGFVPKHGPNDGLLVPEHGQLSHENDQERLLLTSWGLQRSLAPRLMTVVHFATRAENSPIVFEHYDYMITKEGVSGSNTNDYNIFEMITQGGGTKKAW